MVLRWPVEVDVLHGQKRQLMGRVKICGCTVQNPLLVPRSVSAPRSVERILLACPLAV